MSAKTIHALNSGTIVAADEVPFWDVSANQTRKIAASSIASLVTTDNSILGVVYADKYGVVTDHGDIEQPASIANLCLLADGDPVCIMCAGDKSFPFLTTYTIPANATIIVLSGPQFVFAVNVAINGRLILTDSINTPFSIESGITLTINGKASLGRGQAFTGDGTVVFGTGAVEACLPEWWGLSGTDDTAAVQAAIDAAPEYEGVVRLPAQDMKFNVTISKVITFEGSKDLVGDNYCYPYIASDPVITIGNPSTNKEGIILSTLNLNANTTGQKGILVEVGAYYPRFEKISVNGFTDYQIRISGTAMGEAHVGRPQFMDLYLDCGSSGDGIQAQDSSFTATDVRILSYDSGYGHALNLVGAQCYINNGYIVCKHNRGILMEDSIGNTSVIWSRWLELTALPTELLTLSYLGAGSAATVSIEDNDDDYAPDLLTTTCTGAPGDNLSIDLNSYATILDLVTHINTTYAGTYLASETLGSEASTDLSLVTETNIKSSAGSLTANIGIESMADSVFEDFVRGPSLFSCCAKNSDEITKDFGPYDLRSYWTRSRFADIDKVMIKSTGDSNDGLHLIDSSNNSNEIKAYESSGHWYLEVNFNGTAKKVELT